MNLPLDASQDQSNCPPDYYRRNNGMLHQIPTNDVPAPSQSPLTPADLAALESMPREALLKLVQRVGGAIWGYALADDVERAEAARLKLYNLGMSATEVHKVVPALDKWFDRTLGKAAQVVSMNVTGSVENKIMLPATRRFLDSFIEPVVTIDQ